MTISQRRKGLSRRELLGSALAASAGMLLAACGGAATPTAAPAAPTKAPAAEPTKPAAAPAAAATKPAAQATKPAAAPAAQPAAKASGPAKVTFMSIGGAKEQEMFKAAMAETEKALANDKITIEWQPDPGGGWDKIMSMFAADQAYDVQRIDDDRVAALAMANKIWQLDPYMRDIGMKVDDFFPLFWATLNMGGYQFSLNPLCGANAVYYNADLLQKAGVPMPPKTWKEAWGWDEFVGYSEKLSVKDARGRPTQYAFGFPTNVSSSVAYGAGGTYVSEDQTKCTMTDKAVHDALDKLVQLTKPGGKEFFVPPGVNRRELFNAGKLAMNWDSMDFVANISKNITNWDLMPFVKTPKYAYTENYDRTFVLSKTAKFPEAAFKVLYSQAIPPVIDVYAKAKFGVPYHRKTAEGPLFLGSSDAPKTKQVWIETMQEIDGRPVDIPTPRAPAMEVAKNTFVETKFNQALSGQMTTMQFLEAGCKEANDSITQFQWKAGQMEKKLEEAGAVHAKGVKMQPKTFSP